MCSGYVSNYLSANTSEIFDILDCQDCKLGMMRLFGKWSLPLDNCLELSMDRYKKDMESNDRKNLISTMRKLRDPRYMLEASQNLREYNKSKAVQILDEILSGKDRDLRELSIRAYVLVDANMAFDVFLKLLVKKNESLKWFICYMLTHFSDDRAESPLIDVAMHDRNSNIRYMAIIALKNMASLNAIDALEKIAKNDKGKTSDGRSIKNAAIEVIRCIHSRNI